MVLLLHDACMEAGVDLQTFEEWKEKEKADPDADEDLCENLVYALVRAEIIFKYRLIQKIIFQVFISKNFRASIWLLSHKFPEEFGPVTTEEKRFVDRLYARSKFNKKSYRQILDDSKKDWRAAAYLLIERFPEEFKRIRGRKSLKPNQLIIIQKARFHAPVVHNTLKEWSGTQDWEWQEGF